MGNLGRALVNSSNFLIRGAQLAALYDVDPDVIGTEIAGHVVRPWSDAIVPATVGRDLRAADWPPRRSPTSW